MYALSKNDLGALFSMNTWVQSFNFLSIHKLVDSCIHEEVRGAELPWTPWAVCDILFEMDPPPRQKFVQAIEIESLKSFLLKNMPDLFSRQLSFSAKPIPNVCISLEGYFDIVGPLLVLVSLTYKLINFNNNW